METNGPQIAPPLAFSWSSPTQFTKAVAGNSRLYGINPAGRVVALAASDGAVIWQSTQAYASTRLIRSGARLFAYQLGRGLAILSDSDRTVNENLLVSFGASETTNMSTPVIDGEMVYYAINQGLYAAKQQDGLRFGAVLSDIVPHSVGMVAPQEIVTVDGKGVPSKYRVTATAFERAWEGEPNGVDAGQTERPFVVAGSRLVVGVGQDLVAYDLSTGEVAWHLGNVPAKAFATDGEIVYAAFQGVSVWAIEAVSGHVLWQRQYVYNPGLFLEYSLSLVGDSLYFGGTMAVNPDGAMLMAIDSGDGSFLWLSRAAAESWVGGIPVSDGTWMHVYGAPRTGSYVALSSAVRVLPEHLTVSPRPLRGSASAFSTGTITVNLSVPAKVSISLYRESLGRGTTVVSAANWSTGSHAVTCNLIGPGGYSDNNQFGYVLFDIEEEGGPTYSQAVLLPVNSFPDVLWHWARGNVETMTYHRFVNGYEDQTFKPDNLVTRAESSTIIAKTLGLEGPTPGFNTKFTDISGHWARNYIMALEEKDIVGGFAEPDGTYTFRPNLNMTRAQEARILVRAYSIPPAPAGFKSKFTDIVGHWAEADIKALEAAGYVNGFRESDGSFTYRPNQNLTRAELCTVVVRIRKLSR